MIKFSKKILWLALIPALVFACACSGGEATVQTDEPAIAVNTAAKTDTGATVSAGGESDVINSDTAEDSAQGAFYFISGDVRIEILADAQPVLDALGEPNGSFESPSCAYQGSDMYYYYDALGFELCVNEVGDSQKITSIRIIDDTVSTPEGVRIGMNMAEALKKLGDGYVSSGDSYTYTRAGSSLTVQENDDGTVSAIQYAVADGE